MIYICTLAFHHDRYEALIQIFIFFVINFWWEFLFFLYYVLISARFLLFLIRVIQICLFNMVVSSLLSLWIINHFLYNFFIFEFNRYCLIKNLFQRWYSLTLITIKHLQTLYLLIINDRCVLTYLRLSILLITHLDHQVILFFNFFFHLLVFLIQNINLQLILLLLLYKFRFQLL